MAKLVTSPDGGASVPRGTVLKTKVLSTIPVRLKGTETECVINASDFDEERHERLSPKMVKIKAPSPSFEPLNEDELRSMTIAALQALPHFAEIPNNGALKKKDDIIEALLLVPTK